MPWRKKGDLTQLHFFSENHETEGSNTKLLLLESDNLSHIGLGAHTTMKSLKNFNVIAELMLSGTGIWSQRPLPGIFFLRFLCDWLTWRHGFAGDVRLHEALSNDSPDVPSESAEDQCYAKDERSHDYRS